MKKENIKHKRPSWDEYFIGMSNYVGSRATCDRGRSGCVIVNDKRILTTGYVGSPIGLPHCDEMGHKMHTVKNEDGTTSEHCIRTAHAEQNAINNAARSGVALRGSTMYSKMTPCYKCAQSIVNVGIVRVVCERDYHASKFSKEIFKQAKVKLDIFNKDVEKYSRQ
ncbi:MAG: cytidine/deoxycytidylate deaminase family protein [Patescibacteria group bacterium]